MLNQAIDETTLSGMDKTQLLDIMNERKITKPSGKPFTKRDAAKHMREMILSTFDDEVVEIARYQVRYTGYSGQNTQIGKKTRKEYTFVRGDWTDVAEMDWNYFKTKVEKTVNAKQDPHWDVRTIDVFDSVKEFFVDKIAKIRNKKITNLDDVPELSSRRDALKKYEIRSINQFLGIPHEWLITNLKFSRNELYQVLDKIRSSKA